MARYNTEGYTIEDWARLTRAVEEHRTIRWDNVLVWLSVIVIAIAFWGVIGSLVFRALTILGA